MSKIIFISTFNPSISSTLIVNDGTTWESFTNDLCQQLQFNTISYLELHNSLDGIVGDRITNMEEYFEIMKLWEDGMRFKVIGDPKIAENPSPIVNFQDTITKDFASSLQSILAGLSRLETTETDDEPNARQSMASLKTSAEMELERQRDEEAKKRLKAEEDSRRLREILESEKRQASEYDSKSSPTRSKSSSKTVSARNSETQKAEDYHPPVSYSTDEDSVYPKYSHHSSHSENGDSRRSSYDDEDQEWNRAEEQRAKQKAREVERQKRVQTIANQRRTLEEGNSKPTNQIFGTAESSHHVGGSRLRAMGGVKLLMKKPIEIAFRSFNNSNGELVKVSVEDQCDWIELTSAVGVYLNIDPTQITHFVLIDEDGDEASGKIGDSSKFWKFFDRYTSVEGRSFCVHFHPHELNKSRDSNGTHVHFHSSSEATDAPSLLSLSQKKGPSKSNNPSGSHPPLPSKSQQLKTESFHFRLSTDYMDERILIPIPSDCNWKTLTDTLLSHLNIPKGTKDVTSITRISLFDEDGDEIAGPFDTEEKFWKAARSRYGGTTVFVAAIETTQVEHLPTPTPTPTPTTLVSNKSISKRELTNSSIPSNEIFFCLDSHSPRVGINIPVGSTWDQINQIVIDHFKLSGKAIASLTLSDDEDEVFGGIIEERKFWKSIKTFYKAKEMKYILTLKDIPIEIPTISLPCRLSTSTTIKNILIPLNGTWEQINFAIVSNYSLVKQEIDFIELVDSDEDVFGNFQNEIKFWKSVKTAFATQSDMIYIFTMKPSTTSSTTSTSSVTKSTKLPLKPTKNILFRLSTELDNQQSSIAIPIDGNWEEISNSISSHYTTSTHLVPSGATLLHMDFKDSDGDDIIKMITSDKKFWKAVKISENTSGTFIVTFQENENTTSTATGTTSSGTSRKELKKLQNDNSSSQQQSFLFISNNSKYSQEITIPSNASWDLLETILVTKLKLFSNKIQFISLYDEDNDPLYENIHNSNKFWKVIETRYQYHKGMYFLVYEQQQEENLKKTSQPIPPPIPTISYKFRLMNENETISHEIPIPINGNWNQICQSLIDGFHLTKQSASIDRIDLVDQDGDVISSDITNEKKFWKIAQKGYSNNFTIFVITYTIPPPQTSVPLPPTIAITCRLTTDNIEDKAIANIPEDGSWEDIVDSILHCLGASHHDDIDHLDLIDNDGDEIFGMIDTAKKFWKAFKHRYDSNQMIFVVTLTTIQYTESMDSTSIPPSITTTSIPTINYSFTLSSQLSKTSIQTIPIPEEGTWEIILETISSNLHLSSNEIITSLQLIDYDGDDVFSKIIDIKKFWKAAKQKYVENETIFLVHTSTDTSNSNVFIPSIAASSSMNDIPLPTVSIYKKKISQPSPTTTTATFHSSTSMSVTDTSIDSSTRSHNSDPSSIPSQVSIYKKKSSSTTSSSMDPTPKNFPTKTENKNSTDSKYAGRVVAVDCKLSTEGLDQIRVVSIPAMGTWDQINETIVNVFNLAPNTSIDRIDLLDNDDVVVTSNIVSSSKFWKTCLEQYQESETYFNFTMKKGSNSMKLSSGSTPSGPSSSSSHTTHATATTTATTTSSTRGGNTNTNIINFLAACGDGDLEAVTDYLQHGYDVNLKDDSNLTGLHIACIHGHYNIVQLLVDKEASITCRDLDGMTPLHFACENNHTQIAIYLVRMGADTSLRNRAGLTSLHYICLCGNMQLTVLIRDYLINVATSTGLTLLHCVADQGHYDLMKYLLEHSAQLSPRDDEGLTPLHLSVINGHINCVKLLIENGAYWNIRDDKGMSPLLHACNEGNIDIVIYLLSSHVGCNVFARNDNGDTALHLASSTGSIDLVKYLLSKKIEINSRNKKGETPLDIAIQSGCEHLVNWLRERGAIKRPETREEAVTREKVDEKTETAARAYEAEEMLNLQRELEAKKR